MKLNSDEGVWKPSRFAQWFPEIRLHNRLGLVQGRTPLFGMAEAMQTKRFEDEGIRMVSALGIFFQSPFKVIQSVGGPIKTKLHGSNGLIASSLLFWIDGVQSTLH